MSETDPGTKSSRRTMAGAPASHLLDDGRRGPGAPRDPEPTRAIDPWVLEYWSYEPGEERVREALCTLSNSRFATRGAAPEHRRDEKTHYPGTYVAGLYNRLTTEKADREIVNESLVNIPNWLPLTFSVEDGPWFSIDDVDIARFRQALEMRRGLLVREVTFTDRDGRTTSVSQRRLVHMGRTAVAALETNIRAEDWEGRLRIRSGIDGGVENRNVSRYSDLPGRHLEIVETFDADEGFGLRARTNQSRVEIVVGARHRVWLDGRRFEPHIDRIVAGDEIGEDLALELSPGSVARIEKVASVRTGRDPAIFEPGSAVEDELSGLPDFAELEEEHSLAWWSIWERFELDVAAEPRVRLITNLHLFHLVQVASPNLHDLDVGLPARGLHGEAYRGHIFWDEMFVFPLLYVRAPGIAQAVLRYRYRRLPQARIAALSSGYEGAMFPWQSGSDGREETQELHLNPRSGRWNPDRSHRQRHINIAIAYNIIQYLRFTGDIDFLAEFGAEMLVEICRFWASIADYDRLDDRFEIAGVMGPDEFHDDDPGWEGPGLRNNAYTNVMVSWLLSTVPDILRTLPRYHQETLFARLGLNEAEMEHWDQVSRRLTVPRHDERIISQFEGYENLEELDWESYRERYRSIERLDRILEAEEDSTNRYKASKQADVLMLFYLLSYEELVDVFERLGVAFDEQMLAANIDYYLDRTSHGSTLSRVVHSWVLARNDRRRSYTLFREALESDVSDIQGGTTEEGIHLGAMAGTVDLLQRGYSGMEASSDGTLRFKPRLPAEIERLNFRIYYRRRWIDIELDGVGLTLRSEITDQPPVSVEYRGERTILESGDTKTFQSS